MDLFNILAILITLTALFSYINHRYIGLPNSIGVMIISLLISLVLILMEGAGLGLEKYAERLLKNIDFNKALLQGMLSFLLFAGALHININDLAERKWSIGLTAVFGTLFSVFLVGIMTWKLFQWLHINLPLSFSMLFGALISPTDPIAVLGIIRNVGAPKSLETKIAGESLFNDGIGVVLFIIILEIATGGHELQALNACLLFFQEAVGGALFGLLAGYLAYLLLKSIENYQVELLITLALVTGGYALAGKLHLSGPIAIVMAGLLIGNRGRLFAMSENTQKHLDIFWELVDEILNAILFLLIGMELLVISLSVKYLLAGLIAIPTVLAARFIAVGSQISLLKPFREFSPGAVRIMTWGGLRGGISVALALSLPSGPERDLILTITYAVVIFSILVQGLTVGKLIRKTIVKNQILGDVI